ncbi:MAG: NADP-dependent isocitrate dehydrogenase, partial [Bacteroidota bacterium]
EDAELSVRFQTLATELASHEAEIIDQLNEAQGKPVDVGGYYNPDVNIASVAMRPSATLNSVLGV